MGCSIPFRHRDHLPHHGTCCWCPLRRYDRGSNWYMDCRCDGNNGRHRNGRFLLLLWPENRFDSQNALFLNQAAQVLAEQLAQYFVDHSGIAPAHDRIAEFPLDGRKRGFDVRPLMIMSKEFILPELEKAEHFLEHTANAARRVDFGQDIWRTAKVENLIHIVTAQVSLVAAYFINGEVFRRSLHQRYELRAIGCVFVQDAYSSNGVCLGCNCVSKRLLEKPVESTANDLSTTRSGMALFWIRSIRIGLKAGFSKNDVTFMPGIGRVRKPCVCASSRSQENRRALKPQ
jgi:hypothetical protein